MDDDPPIALFKLGEKDHMAQLLSDGHVFMRPLLDFKTMEHSESRLDPDEGSGYCKQADGAILRMEHENEWLTVGKLAGPLRISDRNLEQMNIYCLHARKRSDQAIPFKLERLGFGDSYVAFFDANEFLRRLSQAIRQAGHQPRYAMVDYVDRGGYTGPMGAFRKFAHYSNQRELRIAAIPGTGYPLSLYLGNLTDIAVMGSASENLLLESTSPSHHSI